MIHIPLNVFISAEILRVGFWGSVMHKLFLSRPDILVGSQISIFLRHSKYGAGFKKFKISHTSCLQGETIPVGRKIKVAICSFEVDHLSSSEGCMGLFVKIYFQSPQARNHHPSLIWWTTCGCGRQGVFLSGACVPLQLE